MKTALIVAAAVAARLRTDGPVSSWVIPDSWSIGMGENEGKPVIVRFNAGLASLPGHPSFRHEPPIEVPFNQPTGDGLPQGGHRG